MTSYKLVSLKTKNFSITHQCSSVTYFSLHPQPTQESINIYSVQPSQEHSLPLPWRHRWYEDLPWTNHDIIIWNQRLLKILLPCVLECPINYYYYPIGKFHHILLKELVWFGFPSSKHWMLHKLFTYDKLWTDCIFPISFPAWSLK